MPYKERGGWRGTVRTKTTRDTKRFPSKKEALAWEGEKRKDLKNSQTKIVTGLKSLCEAYLDYMERYPKGHLPGQALYLNSQSISTLVLLWCLGGNHG